MLPNMTQAILSAPETIHPALWRASQLARGQRRGIDTGFAALSAQLPEQGWPAGVLIELLLAQDGIGELRLLRHALRNTDKPRIALLQTPQQANAAGWQTLGIPATALLDLHAGKAVDALWAAEQVLRADSCGSLLFWQAQIRDDALRRLHLAAQSGNTLFFLLRPLSCARQASPAPLRLALRPAADGIDISFIKRRGPQQEHPLHIALQPSPNLFHHAPVDRPAPAIAAAGSVPTELVG